MTKLKWARGAALVAGLMMSVEALASGLCEDVQDDSRVLALTAEGPQALVVRHVEFCDEVSDGERRWPFEFVALVGPDGPTAESWLLAPLDPESLARFHAEIDADPGDVAALAAFRAEHGFVDVAPVALNAPLGSCMTATDTRIDLDDPTGEYTLTLHVTAADGTASELPLGTGRDPERGNPATIYLYPMPAASTLAVEATLPYMTGIDGTDDYGSTVVHVVTPAELPVLATCFAP